MTNKAKIIKIYIRVRVTAFVRPARENCYAHWELTSIIEST